MRKQITLGEIKEQGLSLASLMGLREGKYLPKLNNTNLAVKLDVVEEPIETPAVEEVVEVAEIKPINKPSDRFDVDDYMEYREWKIELGGVPSIEDYFNAVDYISKLSKEEHSKLMEYYNSLRR